jgi:hypothetical protein
MRPSKSVPGGCVIGLFGLGSWLYASFCGYALFQIWRNGQMESRREMLNQLTWHAVIAFVVGLVLLVCGWRFAMRTGVYDHWDQNEPRAKF